MTKGEIVSINDDCPHCNSRSSAFGITFEAPSTVRRSEWDLLAHCSVCRQPVLFFLRDDFDYRGQAHPISPADWGKQRPVLGRFSISDSFPTLTKPLIPDMTPASVEKSLLEAELSFSDGRFSAAGACYRKAVERSLKLVAPELKGMLNSRIRSLEDQNFFPHAMIELLDQVRLLGNEAMHEDEYDPTKEDCEAAREYCQLFFTYIFALPEKIK